jgi:hypothetical protein
MFLALAGVTAIFLNTFTVIQTWIRIALAHSWSCGEKKCTILNVHEQNVNGCIESV